MLQDTQGQPMVAVSYRNPDSTTGTEPISYIARDVLITFSRRAFSKFTDKPNFRTLNIDTKATRSAVRRVLDWMRDQHGISNPSPLTCPGPWPPTPRIFTEMVWMLEACRALDVKQELQGGEVEAGARQYINMAPLTGEEFELVWKVMRFRHGVRLHALRKTQKWFKRGVEDGAQGVPEIKQIREFCEAHDIELRLGGDDAEWEVMGGPSGAYALHQDNAAPATENDGFERMMQDGA